jgi:hypothetical protein
MNHKGLEDEMDSEMQQQDQESEVEGEHVDQEVHQWSQLKTKQAVMKRKVRMSVQPTRQSSRIR